MNKSSVSRVYIYDGINSDWFDVSAVKDYIERWMPWIETDMRKDLLALWAESTGPFVERMCRMRVRHPMKDVAVTRILKPERDYELRVLDGRSRATAGVMYDGNELQRVAYGLLPSDERGLDSINIWFTERAVVTWDEDDRRFHARVSVYGYPSVVSTTGMVVAPAREREYYILRRFGMGSEPKTYGKEGTFLDFRDPVATEVAKGYAMQAVFFALTGDPFCDEPECRLYNAHWQREMMAAQLGDDDYCERHKAMLDAWKQAGRCTAQ